MVNIHGGTLKERYIVFRYDILFARFEKRFPNFSFYLVLTVESVAALEN